MYFIDQLGVTDFAVLFPNEKFGSVFRVVFEEILTNYQCRLTDSVAYEPGQIDYSDQIVQLIRGYQRMAPEGQVIHINKSDKKLRNRRYEAQVDFQVLFIPDSLFTIAAVAPQLR